MYMGEIGNLSEGKILAAFVAAGYLVSVPFGSGHKYALVTDDGTQLYRVQCKTGRVRNGVLRFNAYSMSGNGCEKQNYRGLADLSAVSTFRQWAIAWYQMGGRLCTPLRSA